MLPGPGVQFGLARHRAGVDLGRQAFARSWADLVLRADGTWRVVELGDGQVSDRPATTEPHVSLSSAIE
jgi:hypothetical protein